jgi:hypothetical protein
MCARIIRANVVIAATMLRWAAVDYFGAALLRVQAEARRRSRINERSGVLVFNPLLNCLQSHLCSLLRTAINGTALGLASISGCVACPPMPVDSSHRSVPLNSCRLEALRQLVPHTERANTANFLEEVVVYVQGLQVCSVWQRAGVAKGCCRWHNGGMQMQLASDWPV